MLVVEKFEFYEIGGGGGVLVRFGKGGSREKTWLKQGAKRRAMMESGVGRSKLD